jgi:hypothetical protein
MPVSDKCEMFGRISQPTLLMGATVEGVAMWEALLDLDLNQT